MAKKKKKKKALTNKQESFSTCLRKSMSNLRYWEPSKIQSILISYWIK